MKQFIEEKPLLTGIAFSFLVAFIFSFTPLWHAAVLAGFFAGFTAHSLSRGALAGFTGVVTAWALYIVIQNNWTLLDQIGGLIIGDPGLGVVMFIIIIICGGILGALGSFIGSAIRSMGRAVS